MSKSRPIWGIDCLVLAALLAVGDLALPTGRVMFMVNDGNKLWVLVVVLGILGVWLLATTGWREREADEAAEPRIVDEEKVALNRRLETIG